MRKYVPENLICTLRLNKSRYCISVFWILGLLMGTIFAKANSSGFISFAAISGSACSPANSVWVMLLPLVLGVAFCAVCHPLLYVYLFLKGFVYAFILVNINTAFCAAGWLINLLLLSTDTILVFIFLVFALQSAEQGCHVFKRNAVICMFAVAVVIAFHLYCAIPFTSLLLNG